MSGWVAGLPAPLCFGALALAVAAMVLLSLAGHGRCSEGWGNGLLVVAVFCLVLAFGIAS